VLTLLGLYVDRLCTFTSTFKSPHSILVLAFLSFTASSFGYCCWIVLFVLGSVIGSMNGMSLSALLYSSIAVALTSAVPLLIFLALGPVLFKSPNPLFITFLVSLAVGSLLGDVFFHLIPEIFSLRGDYLRNCALMMAGVFIFFVGERVLQHYHEGHGHGHLEFGNRSNFSIVSESPSTGMEADEGMELDVLTVETEGTRKAEKADRCLSLDAALRSSTVMTTKPVGLLVLTSDFIHNFVDGIAIGVSFSTSFPVGLSTAVAVFLHEIPHELGDFAILLAAGYSPMTIVLCNVLTTLSSFLGIVVSLFLIVIYGGGNVVEPGPTLGPFATSIKPAILSLTAGNFLYIALADLVPALLHGSHKEEQETPSRWTPWVQYGAFLVGGASMLLIKVVSD
jgi:zinc transporter ZupT